MADKNENKLNMSANAPKKINPFRKLMSIIGNGLYWLGYIGEYQAILIFRFMRNIFAVLLQVFILFAKKLGKLLADIAKGITREIKAPFVYFKRKTQQINRIRQRVHIGKKEKDTSKISGAGIRTSLRFAVGLGSVMLPVFSGIAMVFIIYTVITMEYALSVEVNGQQLGFVEDQNVVEGAKDLLRGRIQLSETQEMEDWQLEPIYTIARAPSYTTMDQLANKILLSASSEDDIVEGTGLYIDGQLFAVTEKGDDLKMFLDNYLQEKANDVPAGASINFANEIVCNPDTDDVFFASSVQEYDVLLETLGENKTQDVYVTADGAMSLSEISLANNLTLEQLMLRNPQYTQEDGDYVPQNGETILTQRAQPVLQVKALMEESYEEDIPFEVVEEENPDLPKGVENVVQRGQEGTQQVTDSLEYIDGELTHRIRIEEKTQVIADPVSQIVEIGTADVSFSTNMGGGAGVQGSYMFPVPGSPYSSRGYVSGGHRGLDINAPAGTPIYASEGGTVTTAGWHYSWGYHIVIQHPGGVQTLYAHCSQLFVSAGQTVGHGQHIGAVGSTGNSSGNHCHLEISVNGQLVDPVAFVGYPY